MATPQLDNATASETRGGNCKPPKPGVNWSSLGFFALSIALAILAVLLATGRVQIGGAPPPPPVQAGHATQIDVVNALRARGLQADIAAGVSVRRGALDVPGQGLKVNGETAYLFLFPDPTSAAAAADVDPSAVLATTDPDASDPFLTSGSNVVIVMPGGNEADRKLVTEALAELPS